MGFLMPKAPSINIPAPPPLPELPPLPDMPELPEIRLPDIKIDAPSVNIPEIPEMPEMPKLDTVEYDDSAFDTSAPMMGTREEDRTDVSDLRVKDEGAGTPTTRRKKDKTFNTGVNNSSGLYINF